MMTHRYSTGLWCTLTMVVLATTSCNTDNAEEINDMLIWDVASAAVAYTDEKADEYLQSIYPLDEELTPAFSMQLDLLTPATEQQEYQTLCDSIIAQRLRILSIQHQPSMSPTKELELMADSLLANYKADVERVVEMYESADQSRESIMIGITEISYEQIHKDSMAYNANNVVSIVTDSYSYSGGAHGLIYMTALNYDLKANKRIDLEQMFVPESASFITTAIRDQLMRMYGVTTQEDLENAGIFDYNDVKVHDNFFIEDSGITFVFNPYEIASYADGIIKVTLPYSAVAPYIQSNYRDITK